MSQSKTNSLLKKTETANKKKLIISSENVNSFFTFFFEVKKFRKNEENCNHLKIKILSYNCYYFLYKMICLHFYDEKNKFQNKFLFFLSSLISINDAHELIFLVETMKRF